MEPRDFCKSVLLSSNAWLFDALSGQRINGDYSDFRETIANSLGETAANVGLVGSAKLGYSLKPKTGTPLKAFNSASDLDIVIVSHSLFERVRQAYKVAFYNGYYYLKDQHADHVFRNFVIVKQAEKREYKSVYLREIWLAMQDMTRTVSLRHRIRQEIKFWIYATWDDVELYHTSGIEQLQSELKDAT